MNMKVKHVITTTFSSLVAIALLVPQPAAATDDKTFPNSMCQPSSGDAVQFFVSGTLNTDPNSGHFTDCPVVRDTMAGSSLSSASMYVIDNSPVEDVECEFLSLTADGSLVASSRRATSGVNSASQLLEFGSLSSASGGNYKIGCRIPKANPNGSGGFFYSQIVSYRVNENE